MAYVCDKTKVSCIFKIQILFFMTLSFFTHILGDTLYFLKYAQEGSFKKVYFYHTRNFCFIEHMQKMSGYPNKNVFILRIKGGMKKGGGLRSQNCFESG